MRNLKIINSLNWHDAKEFNRLCVLNIDDFFREYTNKSEPYKPPFQILSELEDKIKFMDEPPLHILIDYKFDGSLIFELVDVFIEDGNDMRCVAYVYNGILRW